MTYDLARVWNDSLEQREVRPFVPRDYLWASEIGLAPCDIWLRLKGEPPTNPPNPRSLRKFCAGNIFEFLVRLILQRCGILVSTQEHCIHQYEGLLKVTGRLDFKVGNNKLDYLEATQDLNALGLPEEFMRAGRALRDWWATIDSQAFAERIIEVKSCSGFMFDRYERKKSASRNHRLQLFHYLKSTGIEQGELVYISRDDCRMMSVPVMRNDKKTEEEYVWNITEITNFWNEGRQPPIEKCLVWDADVGKFCANWQIAYSGYLTLLYGLKDQMEFDDKYKPIASRWNRVLSRVKNGDKMTDKNKLALDEIKAHGFDYEALLEGFEPEKEEEA